MPPGGCPGRSRAATTRPRRGGLRPRKSHASTSRSTTERSSASSWLGLDGGRQVLRGALGAAPLEDEQLPGLIELLLVGLDDARDLFDAGRQVDEVEVLGVDELPRSHLAAHPLEQALPHLAD